MAQIFIIFYFAIYAISFANCQTKVVEAGDEFAFEDNQRPLAGEGELDDTIPNETDVATDRIPYARATAADRLPYATAAAASGELPYSTVSELNITENWPIVIASKFAQNTVNPLRKVLAVMANVTHNPKLSRIYMNLGDPTAYGNLRPSDTIIAAVHNIVSSNKFNGYGPSAGLLSAREAVVRRFSTPRAPFTVSDVFLTSGVSHALKLAIETLVEKGENILVPQPGFPLYRTLAHTMGIETLEYPLRMGADGLLNLRRLEALINPKTKAIVVNNPANPTGTVFPERQLVHLLRIAQKHKIVIIADEVYGELVFAGAVFRRIAELQPRVPVITCDGISKRYLVPGWRLGWLIIHDPFGVLGDVRRGIHALTMTINGPNMLVQGALPQILLNSPRSHIDGIRKVLYANVLAVHAALSIVPYLHIMRAQGGMYMMVGVDPLVYGNVTDFVRGLIHEKSLYVMPGFVFNAPNWFRILLTHPTAVTEEACKRIVEYCRSLRKQRTNQRRGNKTTRARRCAQRGSARRGARRRPLPDATRRLREIACERRQFYR